MIGERLTDPETERDAEQTATAEHSRNRCPHTREEHPDQQPSGTQTGQALSTHMKLWIDTFGWIHNKPRPDTTEHDTDTVNLELLHEHFTDGHCWHLAHTLTGHIPGSTLTIIADSHMVAAIDGHGLDITGWTPLHQLVTRWDRTCLNPDAAIVPLTDPNSIPPILNEWSECGAGDVLTPNLINAIARRVTTHYGTHPTNTPAAA